MSVYSDTFITMKKIYRLACYKEHKESKPEKGQVKKIADVCPYKFTEIRETCKHCRWFQIIDETEPIRTKLVEKGVDPSTSVLLKLQDFDELPYDPKKKYKLVGE